MSAGLAHRFHFFAWMVFANAVVPDLGAVPILGLSFHHGHILVAAFLAYVFSLGGRHRWMGRVSFVAVTSLLVFTLARLVEHPALATGVAAIYATLCIPQSEEKFSYRRLYLTSQANLLRSFGVALLLYASMLFSAFGQNELLFVATMMALSSVGLVACAKLRIHAFWGVAGPVLAVAISGGLVVWEKSSWYFPVASLWLVLNLIWVGMAMVWSPSWGLKSMKNTLFSKPEFVIIGYFVLFASLGAVFLQFPVAQAGDQAHSLLDSLFTAMSAVCVTGLIVLDTPVDFSGFGQGVILLLIQLGGLGIMSLSAWVLFVFQSKRLSVHHEHTIDEMSAYKHGMAPQDMVKRILGYVLFFEAIGALLLFVVFFRGGDSWGEALWRAVFTSISAFCNAGFALQSDSLVPYQHSSLAMMVVSLLIITGGFAPMLVWSLPQKNLRKLSLQEKLTFVTTAVLLLGGFSLFLLLEWGHALGDLGVWDKVTNAWFQSVTTRTAGFNSVDLGAMRDVTMLLFVFLMFVGGNPGGTAGGIKTVTLAVIVCAGLSALRGGKDVRAFHRGIRVEVVFKAIAVAGMGLVTGFVAYVMLAVTQTQETIPLLFEVVSALATVGLSLGVTPHLDEVGKVIIIVCMLAGRVGPMTFVLSLMRQSPERRWDVPKEDLFVS